MSPATVLCVFGTRPDTIKMAPVIAALRGESDWCRVRVCVTAQHRHLLDQLLALFDITPDHDLDVMRRNQTLPDLTARLLRALQGVIVAERPDWVIVQGDTTTAFAAGVAAFYAQTRVAHVEAGLRTGRKDRPFPEEMNRRLLGRLADLHLAPTEGARQHLLAEGVADDAIVVTGNTAIDALRWIADQEAGAEWRQLDIRSDARLVLVTTHRRESFGLPLQQTCQAVQTLARTYPDSLQVLLPVHPNPSVRDPVYQMLGSEPNVLLTPPLAYPTLVHAIRRSFFVITDSGGIQEEAPSLGRPVLVLRDSTERPEGIAAGVAALVGTDPAAILAAAGRLLNDPLAHQAMARQVDIYGDGHAARRIARALKVMSSRSQ